MTKHRIFYFLLLVITASLAIAAPVTAATISQGYASGYQIESGTLIARNDLSNTVEPANVARQNDLLGVAVLSDESSLAVTSKAARTQVVTTGITSVYVTELTGKISKGDPITISPIVGVGMKALVAGKIVGYAAGYTVSGRGKTVTVSSSDGREQRVTIQSIPLNVSVENYGGSANQTAPQSLQSIADKLAGNSVALPKIIVSCFVLIFAALAVVVVLYTGIHFAFTAIGRNPLAKQVISQILFKVIMGAIIIAGISLLFAYLILRI